MILRLLILGAAASLADPLSLYDQALAAREQRDAQRFLATTAQLVDWAPMSPPLRFLHAEALALSGRSAPAIAELRWLARHGYHYAFWERGIFGNLPAGAQTTALREEMTRNGAPSGTIVDLIRIDLAGLDPEGIDTFGAEWIVGSMANGSLYRVERSGKATLLWHEAEKGRRLFGVRHDPQRDVVWACSNGADDRHASPHLLRIALRSSEVTRSPLPDPNSLCNDVALLPDGAVAVSDSQHGAVWQLTHAGEWRRLAEVGTFAYPNGLTYLAAARRLVVADLRGLWTIDLADARTAAVRAPDGTFVGGIDGLYAVGGELLAIQNGVRPHRVVRVGLSRDARRVERVSAIAANLAELADMTTAAVVRGEITVLAGSQLVRLVSRDSADD